MNLVDRYVYHVAQQLPESERAEIERELRSQIQDTLENRFGATPAPAEVASVLRELGEPRKLAASYGNPPSLVGPELYPYLREVLRYGWIIIPSLVLLAHGISALTDNVARAVIGVAIQGAMQALESAVLFTGIVVLIFVALEREGVRASHASRLFDPFTLSDARPAARIDQTDAGVAIAFNLFTAMLMVYFLHVGGLTWRLNLDEPGRVLPVPAFGLMLLLLSSLGDLAVHTVAIVRKHWTFRTWLASSALDVISVVGLYVSVLKPLVEYVNANVPALRVLPLASQTPELISLIVLAIILAVRARKLYQLWPRNNGGLTASAHSA